MTLNPKVTQFRNYWAGLEFRTSHNLPLFLLYIDFRSPQDQTVLSRYLGDLGGILISKIIFSLGCCHPSRDWRSCEKHGENKDTSLEHVSKNPSVKASISHAKRQFSHGAFVSFSVKLLVL